jgi:nicotinamidase-related amidase
MTNLKFEKQITALIVIDPYNDFISEGGKIWNSLKTVAESNGCVPHMLQVLNAARRAELHIFYALHHRYRPGDYENWKYIAPIQKAAWRSAVRKSGNGSRGCSITECSFNSLSFSSAPISMYFIAAKPSYSQMGMQ